MTLLTIGSDRQLFRPSTARERIASYGKLFDYLLIVVFTKRGFEKANISSHVSAYPTNSFSKLLYVVDAYRVGARVIRSLPPEKRKNLIISSQDPFESGLVAYILARRFGARLHMQIHTDLFSPYFGGVSFMNRVRVLLAKFLLPRARCIRVVSERIKRSLIKLLAISSNRITVLPIQNKGLIYEKTINKANDQKFRVLVVARLEPEKGIDVSLKAFAAYKAMGGDGILDIVGDGSQRTSLEALTRELGITDHVVFHGWSESVSAYYAAANCFLMTSWYEGWGVAAADAVYSGIPVVMTNVGLAGEVVRNGENGLIAFAGDITGLAERLIRLERDRGLYDKLADKARETSGEDPEVYLKKYQETFERCRQ